jgi:hypothetical protein
LISKCFGLTPENLWITLLKTCLQGLQGLANQGFRQIAHQMGIFIKPNEINDLAEFQKRQEGHATQTSGKVASPFFVHKSRGEVGILQKNCIFGVIVC